MSHFVRIIGGRFRGKKLSVLDREGLRPTTDRVRETLFNWLMQDIKGAHCLDLFAGTGALGFEALSRGADAVTLIEQDKKAFHQLTRMASHFNHPAVTIINNDAIYFLKSNKKAFDIIFLDPPFASALDTKAIAAIESHHSLKPGGLLYLESNQSIDLNSQFWTNIKQKKAGTVFYSLWQYQEMLHHEST